MVRSIAQQFSFLDFSIYIDFVPYVKHFYSNHLHHVNLHLYLHSHKSCKIMKGGASFPVT